MFSRIASYRISTHTHIEAVGIDRWDALARSCGAPVFYRTAFLSAFEQFPLHASLRRIYLIAEDAAGALQFAMPLYLLRRVDPMKLLATHFPAEAEADLLLNHVWHCYDTWLLATRLDADLLQVALDATQDLARENGAAVWGFSNVDGEGPLAKALDAAGLVGRDVDQRFVADLTAWRDVGAYLASLPRSARSNMTRYEARAREAYMQTAVVDAAQADLDGFVTLARANAEKYGNADYYRPGLFQPFVRALGSAARVVEHRLDGRLVGSAILLIDDARLHFWLAGNDYDAVPFVSPFYLCFLAAMKEAMATGKRVLEAGRRNPTFKLRYGMQAKAVRAYLTSTPTYEARRSGRAPEDEAGASRASGL